MAAMAYEVAWPAGGQPFDPRPEAPELTVFELADG